MKPLNNKGVALLLVVFSVILIFHLVTEILYETTIEYAISAQSVRRLKAYYAARSGVELSILRIKIYNQVKAQMGKEMGASHYLDMIWSFPFAWPPLVPDLANEVEKNLVNDTVKTSLMDANYRVDIFEEGSKIDINDLNSESKVLMNISERQLNQILTEKQKDEKFVKRNPDFRPDVLIKHLIDWQDLNTEAIVGGSEKQQYPHLSLSSGSLSSLFPPNRGFRTVGEIRLIPGMNSEIFNFLEKNITVYGMKAINPNHAPKEVLRSLDATITEEVAQAIIQRRNEENGYFRSPEGFWTFVNEKGGRVSKEVQDTTPINCDTAVTFRIRSIGEFQNQTHQIEAIVFDVIQVANTVSNQIIKERPTPPPGNNPPNTPKPGQNSGLNTGQSNPLSKGEPRIVYWNEK